MQIAAELQILRTICDERVSYERRLTLLQSYSQYLFSDPEHQVVFESIHQLFAAGLTSAPRLTVHLNNRGFPDIDVDKYFPPKTAGGAQLENANKQRASPNDK